VMQLGGDRQRTRRVQECTTSHSLSHARTLWILTEHERMELPNVAAFSVILFAIYSWRLHGLRHTITPPHTLALRHTRLNARERSSCTTWRWSFCKHLGP
jgi:hypothetical protein